MLELSESIPTLESRVTSLSALEFFMLRTSLFSFTYQAETALSLRQASPLCPDSQHPNESSIYTIRACSVVKESYLLWLPKLLLSLILHPSIWSFLKNFFPATHQTAAIHLLCAGSDLFQFLTIRWGQSSLWLSPHNPVADVTHTSTNPINPPTCDLILYINFCPWYCAHVLATDLKYILFSGDSRSMFFKETKLSCLNKSSTPSLPALILLLFSSPCPQALLCGCAGGGRVGGELTLLYSRKRSVFHFPNFSRTLARSYWSSLWRSHSLPLCVILFLHCGWFLHD